MSESRCSTHDMYGRRAARPNHCCGDELVSAGKHVNPLNNLVHLQLLCAQRGKGDGSEGFSWQVESSSKQSSAHS